VDQRMNEILSEPSVVADGLTQPSTSAGSRRGYRDLVILGLNHEQQHQELFLTDLKFTFSLNPLFPTYREDFAIEEKVESGADSFVELNGGIYEIGFEGEEFCFDNELARHKVYLDAFEISSRLITNLEYLEFIQDGGYRDHRLWHSEGWD